MIIKISLTFELLIVIYCAYFPAIANDLDIVKSYVQLRQLNGAPDQHITLLNSKIGGTFLYKNNHPYEYFEEDNGITIKSANGWWVRQFDYSEEHPIELDWYKIKNGDDITLLIKKLSALYKPDLYIRSPTTAMTITLKEIDFEKLSLKKFSFFESSVPITLKQIGTKGRLWSFKNMDEIVIGSKSTKSHNKYNLTIEGTWSWKNRSTDEHDSMIFSFCNKIPEKNYHFRFNTINPKGPALRSWGTKGPNHTFVAGIHYNSAFQFGTPKGTVEFEDPVFSDPLGYGHGWTGNINGEVLKNISNPRARVVSLIFTEKVVGSLTLQYGASRLSIMFADIIGENINKPLIIRTKDIGYSGPNNMGLPEGIAFNKPWFLFHDIKFDGLGKEVTDKRYLKLIEVDTYGDHNSPIKLYIESTSCDDIKNCSGVVVSYTDITLINAHGLIEGTASGIHKDDNIHHTTYRGDGVHPAHLNNEIRISNSDTVRDGQYNRVRIKKLNQSKFKNSHGHVGGSNNSIINITLKDKIIIDAEINNTILKDVAWSGKPRVILKIGKGSYVTASNLCAPRGSKITGAGIIRLHGNVVHLPYQVRSTDCLNRIGQYK